MCATVEGAARYAGRFPEYQECGFYRTVFGLRVSGLGVGADPMEYERFYR